MVDKKEVGTPYTGETEGRVLTIGFLILKKCLWQLINWSQKKDRTELFYRIGELAQMVERPLVKKPPYNGLVMHSSNLYMIAHMWNQLPAVTKSSTTLAQFRARPNNVNFTGCQCINCI